MVQNLFWIVFILSMSVGIVGWCCFVMSVFEEMKNETRR